MESVFENNYIRLSGTVQGEPKLSHTTRSRRFYIFPPEVCRLSGTADVLNIVACESLLDAVPPVGERTVMEGEIRTFNNRNGEGARLVITVFARQTETDWPDDENYTALRGTLCKAAILRTTSMGRDICDIMLAVNRHYGGSDYIPCICWVQRAREAAFWDVGDGIELTGRLQSRRYLKVFEYRSEERTAYEVSAGGCETYR